ncbi:MAG: signal peptidase I [Clostridiales bacterium]|nr:signal peptidase I [Clostridiales bacterium]
MSDFESVKETEERAETEEKENRRSKLKGFFLELIIYALILVACVTVIPNYVLQRTIVSGHSMEDTLQDGDNLLVEKVSYHFTQPKRFDIVMFYPYGKEAKEYYVKRVIGLPGETIQIKGEDIYINGSILEEHYGKDPIDYSGIAEHPLTLGEDEYFLMGDNREVSLDSRYEEVGPVHKKLISGRALIRIWPFSEFGSVE